MSDNTYNGWCNYETWNWKLWVDNGGATRDWDEHANELVRAAIDADESNIRESAIETLRADLEADCDEQASEFMASQSGPFADLLNAAVGRINWHDIAEHMIDDIDLYSAGWNMPGYMPDSPPAIFMDADDALEYIKDEAKRAIEDGSSDTAEAEAADDVALNFIDSWKADSKGEFGATVNAYYYFVTRS